jgi:hypothetical protein
MTVNNQRQNPKNLGTKFELSQLEIIDILE